MCSFSQQIFIELLSYARPVPSNVGKTIQRNSLSSGAHALTECGCHSGGDADAAVCSHSCPFHFPGVTHALWWITFRICWLVSPHSMLWNIIVRWVMSVLIHFRVPDLICLWGHVLSCNMNRHIVVAVRPGHTSSHPGQWFMCTYFFRKILFFLPLKRSFSGPFLFLNFSPSLWSEVLERVGHWLFLQLCVY